MLLSGFVAEGYIRDQEVIISRMDGETVQEYVATSGSLLDDAPQMDEANTKAAVLRDFLDLLGWEIPQNTKLEYSVEAFGQTYKVDYALVLEGTPVAFLEAKGADTSLTERHAEQVSSYMTNKNVTYGILTNGKRYQFFQRRVDAANVRVETVGDIQLEDLPERLPVLRAFQRSAIESGESKKILDRINELREARSALESQKDDLAETIAGTLADEISNAIEPFARPQAKEMVDRIVEEIDSEIVADDTEVIEDPPEEDPDIDPKVNHVVGQIRRSKIEGDDEARVAVFPTRRSGVPFLKENNAWGFVRVGSEFDYVAMYVTGDVREVRYVAKVKDTVPADSADLARPLEQYADGAKIAEDKVVVRFESDSLYELEDPIPFESKYPQGHRYTTLEKLRTAETTDGIL
jgi:hypothetical protein